MAFNIDIELGITPEKNYKIHCSTLTEVWSVERSPREFENFGDKLMRDKTVKPTHPLPRQPAKEDVEKVEMFLNRLGCTPAVLRSPIFLEFLDVPPKIRTGLKYVAEKPFGKAMRSGLLQVHPRFVSRPPVTRQIELCLQGQIANLLVYPDAQEKVPMIVLGLLSTTSYKKLPELKNTMVVMSGKRHLVLQASSPKDFENWINALKKALKTVGSQVEDEATKSEKVRDEIASGLQKVGLKLSRRTSGKDKLSEKENEQKLQLENRELRKDCEKCKVQMTELTAQLERMEREKEKIRGNEKELREKKWKEFQLEMEQVEDKHTQQMEELRVTIEELQCKIEEKNRLEGFFKVGTLFSDGFDKEAQTDVQATEQEVGNAQQVEKIPEKKEEQKYNDDGQLEDYQEDTQQAGSTYKMTFKNQHKHQHIHILNHRHTHYHNDTAEKDTVYTQTETLAHTIVHTGTQFQIKKNMLG